MLVPARLMAAWLSALVAVASATRNAAERSAESSAPAEVLAEVQAVGGSDFCVVGAGPAGLQCAHHLQSAGESVVVFEGTSSAGSFYETFPRHGQLISINKKYTGRADPEFSLRHDWNSILTSMESNGTDFRFTDYSEEYFPNRTVLWQYLNDYADRYKLPIVYDARVTSVVKTSAEGDAPKFKLSLGRGLGEVSCGVVVWAAGLGTPRMLKNPLYTPYHEAPVEPSFYRNLSVGIVGAGQSAFELAKAIYGASASTMMLYRNPPKFAWNTH